MKETLLIITSLLVLSCNPFINRHNTTIYKGDIDIDEKAHSKNSLEWWYLTGFMNGDNGKRYGIEYVFFCFRSIDYRQYYMVNTAISCPEDSLFIFDHEIKLSKKVINNDVPLDFDSPNYKLCGLKGAYDLSATMTRHDAGFNLKTIPTQPVVYHQDSGYVQYGKTAAAGYYSYPQLATEGQLYIYDDTINVNGTSWYDRQWNGGDVYQKHVSWDWTAINFSDSTELMLFRVNNSKDNTIELGGTYINKDHSTINLGQEDIIFEPLENWTSPESGRTYPIKWKIKIPKLSIEAVMTAEMNNQELKIKKYITKYYWEGMCKVIGTKGEKEITGESYLEMNNR